MNFVTADGFIAGWNTRYFYHSWRPVTAIRNGDVDGNPGTEADAAWNTFLNTPPIPDYPSTHSTLGSAAAQVLAMVFENDEVVRDDERGAVWRDHASFCELLAGCQ